MRDYRDLVIEDLADSEAFLRQQTTALIDIIADRAFENVVLSRMFAREFVERLYADAALARTRCTRLGRAQRQRGTAA